VLTRDDLASIENMYAAFRDFGPAINYNSRGGGIGGRAFMPSYQELMTETDSNGREWSYLASEESYRAVRDLELRNLIVPITGDFGGPSAIRSVGKFLKDHGAVVSAFYTSTETACRLSSLSRANSTDASETASVDRASTQEMQQGLCVLRQVQKHDRTGLTAYLPGTKRSRH
jgi:hypothetical protein